MPIARRFVPVPLTKSYYAMAFVYQNLWNERLQEIIDRLISGGIIDHFLNRKLNSRWNLMPREFQSEKVILNLTHLGFGFQICFFVLYGSLLVFFGELFVFWIKNIIKNQHKSSKCDESDTKLISNGIKSTLMTSMVLIVRNGLKLGTCDLIDDNKLVSSLKSENSIDLEILYGEIVNNEDDSDLLEVDIENAQEKRS